MESNIFVSGTRVNAYGYILAGANVTWPEEKGKVVLVVESTVASSLSSEVEAFQRDLIGAGWLPIRRDLGRLSTVPDVKNLIRAEYNADPANVRSVILLGHVPVPYSGNIAPDLHESHRGAWPADVYYAEMDGNWTDNSVNIISGDYPANDNRPGDGKFDQSQIPSPVELEIGRIDFYDMPAFGPRTPHDLLRTYLRKNSEFRNRAFTANRRMLIRDNFGDLSGDAPAVDAWRHYRQMFGPGNVREVGPGAFFPTLESESFLWAYGAGGGGNTKADTIGTTSDFARENPQAVFLILHGSYFGDWDTKDNFLRAAIGTDNYTLASIWSGLPHWFMHPMALGRSVGHSTRLTQNNLSNYKSHQNFSAGQVHIALMGDPTLENFPVIPPRNLTGSVAGSINLAWTGSSDASVVGYHLFHSSNASGPFQRLTGSPIVDTAYSHAVGTGTHHYMVRAVKLERTGSGTFYNLSQGVFVTVTKSSGGAVPQINISAADAEAGETGPDTGTVRISRSFADENPLSVEFLLDGTAEKGIDYSGIANSVIIPAWTREAIMTLVPSRDALLEERETVTIQVRPAATYTVGNPPSVVLTIADAINGPPAISEIADQTIVAGSVSGDLLFQVSDPETDASALQVTVTTSNEAVLPKEAIVLEGTGSNRTVRVNTLRGSSGMVTITLNVTDGAHHTATAFDVTITPGNRPPNALAAEFATSEDQVIAINLAATDPDSDILSFEIVTPPTRGTLSGSGDSYTYTPGTNEFGSDSFTFRVRDSEFVSPPATVSLTIVPTNDSPTAGAQVLELGEDSELVFTLIGSDADVADSLSYHVVLLPTNGVLTGTAPNLGYKPHTNYHGQDVLEFVVRDGTVTSAVATVTFIVQAQNDPPVVIPQSLATLEDSAVKVDLAGLDIEGSGLTFRILASPQSGVINGSAPHLVYTPDENFNGDDALTVVANDGSLDSEPVAILIHVQPQNDAPTVVLEAASQSGRKNSTIGPLSLEVADADGPINELTLSAESSNPALIPTNRITFTSEITNRQVTFYPDSGATGQSTITIYVSDGQASAATTFLLTITNTPPTATNDSLSGAAGVLSIPIAHLLANDGDADGDILRIVAVAESRGGRTVQITNDTVVYFGGTGDVQDSFTYVAEDTSGARSTATVLLTLVSAPRIDTIRLVSGSLILSISGPPNRDFEVIASEDGVAWELVGSGAAAAEGRAEFIVNGGASGHHRWYRVRWL